MAEIQSNEGGGKKKKGGSKQKKMSVHVDFTPMVDMNMLLITFFMLATSLSKPQTMELSMPSNDKNVSKDQQSEVKASKALTVLLDKDNKLYYFAGQPDYKNYNSLKTLSYDAKNQNSIRSLLILRNQDAYSKIQLLKKEKIDLKISQDTFSARASRIKNGKNTPVVIIKATDGATYENLVDVLDEMQICNIGKYVIDTISAGDRLLIRNKESNGAVAQGQAN
ncbi:MAG: biopolymer transporter ExbD [Paludibacter sp.]|nr:biopolymer transporter ExbD [Paludibacter sp.]